MKMMSSTRKMSVSGVMLMSAKDRPRRLRRHPWVPIIAIGQASVAVGLTTAARQ